MKDGDSSHILPVLKSSDAYCALMRTYSCVRVQKILDSSISDMIRKLDFIYGRTVDPMRVFESLRSSTVELRIKKGSPTPRLPPMDTGLCGHTSTKWKQIDSLPLFSKQRWVSNFGVAISRTLKYQSLMRLFWA